MSWSQIYTESYREILKELKRLDGIAIGFNTNVDAIVDFSSDAILELIAQLGIDSLSLYKYVVEWKGVIEDPVDFVSGLCGCFEKGKASEWLINDGETYQFLLNNIPVPKAFRMGGQAGIMANLLSEFNIPKVIVHSATLSNELTNLFNNKKNLVVPIYDKKGNLAFVHPRKAKKDSDSVYFHIISEIKKNDVLHFGDSIKWRCPRDNRFIATYDPPNFELQLMSAFEKDIERIAGQINAFIFSGFHMLNEERIGQERIIERIKSVLSLLERAKNSNPDLLIHLELSSTKNEFTMEQFYKLSKKEQFVDSIGCNERELVELLRAIGEKRLGNNIRKEFTQEKVLQGCLKVCEKLNLKRLHVHQLGCYILVLNKDYAMNKELHRSSLCFASLATAEKALTGEILQAYDLLLEQPALTNKTSRVYRDLTRYIVSSIDYIKTDFRTTGFAETPEYLICAIPSIIIAKPIFTVGLGDTISATTLAAELALRKKYLKNKK